MAVRQMKEDWSASQYLKFENERTRPPRDLLAQVPLGSAKLAFDLGCGPANSTELIAARYPQADVVGIDSSPDMLRQARERMPQARFEQADLTTWTPPDGADLLFANAAFQWVPDHLPVLSRLLSALSTGGGLAVQMPDNLDEPAMALMRAVAERPPWRERLAGADVARHRLPSRREYYDRLRPLCTHFDLWHTVYNHVMAGPEAIVEWFKGSSLRPFLQALEPERRDAFAQAYLDEVAKAHPRNADGTVLLPFPRLFIVAQR